MPYLNGVFNPIYMGINGLLILFAVALIITYTVITYNPLYYEFFGALRIDSTTISSVLILMLSLSGISFAAANTKADSFRFLHGGFSAIMTVCWLVIAVALCHWSITFYKLRLDRGEITLVPSRDRYAQDLVDDLFNSFTRSYSEGDCRDGGYDKATKMFIRPYCKEFQVESSFI